MEEVFVGSEALRNGLLTRAQLRWNYRTIFPDVYIAKAAEASLHLRIVGAWLWSGRRGIVSGRAAAALHGALWVEADTPIELTWSAARPPRGILTHNDKIGDDEITYLDGLPVTTPERTAFDPARRLPRDVAVRHLDALARATQVCAKDALILGDRYPRARGLRRCDTLWD